MSTKYQYCHVIAGFPGIGKTTVAKKFEDGKNPNVKFLDFDSAMFKRNVHYADIKEFNIATGQFEAVNSEPYAYVSAIKTIMDKYERDASKIGDKAAKLYIMCSTHSEVRGWLNKLDIPHTIVIPGYSVTAYQTYVKRLTDRYEASLEAEDVSAQEANKRALDAVTKNYYEYIAEINNNPVGKNAQLVVLGDNETLSDYVHHVIVGGILGNLFQACGIPHITPHDVQKALMEHDVLHVTMGSNGEIIFWSDPVSPDLYDQNEVRAVAYTMDKIMGKQSINSAFAGCPYVMISKDVAQGVIDCCNLAIRKLVPETVERDDIAAFGDLAIYYERLIDAVDGFSYLHWHAKRMADKAKKESPFKTVGDDGKIDVSIIGHEN